MTAKLILLASACALLLSACASSGRADRGQQSVRGATLDTPDTFWVLAEVDGKRVDGTSTPSGEPMGIRFFPSEGVFSAWGGCNRMNGEYTVEPDSGRITFGRTSTTRMMCPDMTVEQALLELLSSTRFYIVEGGELELRGGKNQEKIGRLRAMHLPHGD